jgi:DUF917 family protein
MAQINIQDIVSRELTWGSIKELQSGDIVQIVNYSEGRFEIGLATITEINENQWKQRIIRVSNAFIRDVNNPKKGMMFGFPETIVMDANIHVLRMNDEQVEAYRQLVEAINKLKAL